jgi:hypothetical protein
VKAGNCGSRAECGHPYENSLFAKGCCVGRDYNSGDYEEQQLVAFLVWSSTLKIQAVSSTEMSIDFHQITHHNGDEVFTFGCCILLLIYLTGSL